MIWNTIVMAVRAIRRNLMRSLLTSLGVVIGVAAVICVFTLGRGSSQKVTDEVASLGQNMVTIRLGQMGGRGGAAVSANPFTEADVEAISKQAQGVAAAAPVTSKGVRLVYGSVNWSTSLTGTTNQFFEIRNWNITDGRGFSDAEIKSGAAVCIIGQTIRSELFGSSDPLGEFIRVDKISCKVIGVLESLGQTGFGSDQDDIVIAPIRFVQRRLVGSDDVGMIMVSAESAGKTEEVKNELESLMRQRRRLLDGVEDDFRVVDMKEISERVETITGILTLLLSSVAGVSLLVGGIGIMNIMLVSVTERTREIGIRMAIGSRGREVMMQFLVEAVMLSTLGGLIGITLGLGGALIAAKFMDLPFVIAPEIVVIAFVFSSAVGIAFGFFPARKAAHLNPIECLRYE
jgi:putative ABC transport system permease protein